MTLFITDMFYNHNKNTSHLFPFNSNAVCVTVASALCSGVSIPQPPPLPALFIVRCHKAINLSTVVPLCTQISTAFSAFIGTVPWSRCDKQPHHVPQITLNHYTKQNLLEGCYGRVVVNIRIVYKSLIFLSSRTRAVTNIPLHADIV